MMNQYLAYSSSTTTCRPLSRRVAGLRSPPRGPRRAIYAGSCIRTSENSPSRDCMKKGRRVVIRYSSRYEKTLPNGSFRCRMELHRTSHAASFRTWPTADPQPPRDPRRHLLYLEKRLPVASTPTRLSSMAHRLLLL